MFGGISGLSFIQKCYLELSMVFTIVLPLAMLPLTDDALITTLSYQLCCLVVVPLVYIKYLSKEKEITPYFIDEFRNKSKDFFPTFILKEKRPTIHDRTNWDGFGHDCSIGVIFALL